MPKLWGWRNFMKRSSQPRATAELSKSLNHQLNTYALAAGAAGMGVLASVQPADAKIIYTPAHAKIVIGQPRSVDLNHDGITDFYLAMGLHYFVEWLNVCQDLYTISNTKYCGLGGTNAVRTIDSKGMNFGAALRNGEKIQHGEYFVKDAQLLGEGTYDTSSNIIWRGPWMNGGKGVKHRYLGLKFKIEGRFHFGWAPLPVAATREFFTAPLTGYAYENIPGKGIIAGKTKGPDVVTMP